MVSFLANLGLGILAVTLWLQLGVEPEGSGVAHRPVVDPIASPFPHSSNPGTDPGHTSTAWEPFTWQQIESEDYREYMTNLRGLGCPERLIRDLIVAELDDWYRARRNRLRVDLHEGLPPWAGGDRREAASRERARQLHELEQEQWMVITELLGFPWSRYAKQLCLDSILEGHVTADQAIQAGSLLEMYGERLDWVHGRTRGILLAEDRAELTALSGELQARLETVLGPAQWEELLLRMLWSKEVADECQFEFAELTGAEVRQVVRIYAQLVGGIAGVFDSLVEVSHAGRAGGAIEFDRSVSEIFGPEKAGDLTRARDQRFHAVLDFAQEHRLPRHTAITAYEIQVAAEEEVQRLRATAETEAVAFEARLEELQTDTVRALTRVLGQGYLREYFAGAGQWLTALDAHPVGAEEVVP